MSFTSPSGPPRLARPGTPPNPVRRPVGVRPTVSIGQPGVDNLAPGVTAPSYSLVRPANVSLNARWAGPQQPGAGWRGVGGGWWAPSGGVGTRPIDVPNNMPARIPSGSVAALVAALAAQRARAR